MAVELERSQAGIEEQSDAESVYRSGAYALLAALLRAEPGDSLLQHTAALSGSSTEGELGAAMAALGEASASANAQELKNEFFSLFIGIGRGELVPYGSWYLTGFLMERPLGELRSDLARLGFERDDSVREPEDHVAALCEVMSMLIAEEQDMEKQRSFFARHMAPWLARFFADLKAARSASYYRSVARFGEAFTAFEMDFMEIQA